MHHMFEAMARASTTCAQQTQGAHIKLRAVQLRPVLVGNNVLWDVTRLDVLPGAPTHSLKLMASADYARARDAYLQFCRDHLLLAGYTSSPRVPAPLTLDAMEAEAVQGAASVFSDWPLFPQYFETTTRLFREHFGVRALSSFPAMAAATDAGLAMPSGPFQAFEMLSRTTAPPLKSLVSPEFADWAGESTLEKASRWFKELRRSKVTGPAAMLPVLTERA